MAKGREARGGDTASAYQFGDLTRGLVTKSRGLVTDAVDKSGVAGLVSDAVDKTGAYHFGDITRGLVSKLSARGGRNRGLASDPRLQSARHDDGCESSLLGQWFYGKTCANFLISSCAHGQFRFDEHVDSGGGVSGVLLHDGEWLVGDLRFGDGSRLGTIRLRFAEDIGTLVFCLLAPGATEWSTETIAHRPAENMTAGS